MDKKEIQLSILLSGRIYEEDEVFMIIRKIANKFISEVPLTSFYFIDEKTKMKISNIFPQNKCEILTVPKQSQIDYVVTVGGDGTILYTAKELRSVTPPFLSFQKGTLGFLCKFTTEQIDSIIQNAIIAKGMKQDDVQFPFQVCQTMRLQGQLCHKDLGKCLQSKICLNQMYISRVKAQRIILDIYIDDQFLTQTAGDGILVSTPTGSTAYALSAGGPIVQSGVNSILIVPIAPNSLSFRPICFPSSCTIKVKLSQKSRSEGYISFDGQMNEKFKGGDQIIIKASKNDLIFYDQKNGERKMPSWMQRLKHFLGWNEVFKSPPCQDLSKQLKKLPKKTSSYRQLKKIPTTEQQPEQK